MRLKKSIQIVEYSNAALVIGLFFGVIALVAKAGDGKILAFEFLLSALCIIAFFFRKVIINIYLKRTSYPGVFYSAMEKLNLTRNLDLFLTDDLLNEIYKPAYSTDEFLSDNNLKTEIGRKKVQLPLVGLSLLVGIFGLFYFGEKFKINEKPFVFVGLVLFVTTNAYLWTKGKRNQNDTEPILKFGKETLELPDQSLSWKNIFDWNYKAGSRNSSSQFVINYYDADKNVHEVTASLSDLNIDKIDFLLLMAHFKGKYG